MVRHCREVLYLPLAGDTSLSPAVQQMTASENASEAVLSTLFSLSLGQTAH